MTNLVPHISVMLKEVMQYLHPQDDKIYVDCTFGAGGYSKEILARARCKLIGIDKDPEARDFAKAIKGDFSFCHGSYGDIENLLSQISINKVDGIILDLGVSSMQLDRANRGFSFSADGPLDMRMSKEGISAKDVVNSYSEAQLADIIYYYGEERYARKIAKAIVNARRVTRVETTTQLAHIVRSVVGRSGKIDPATKTFQAIRICVNDELADLERVLNASTRLLKQGGKLVVVSFHGLEDKIVKSFLLKHSGKKSSNSRYLPDISLEKNQVDSCFKILTKKVVAPSAQEVLNNPRSRSARLRAAIFMDESDGGKNAS